MRLSLIRTSSRVLFVVVVGFAAVAAAAQTCPNGGTTVVANVVALDQPLMQNRLGAYMPGGMIFALQRDVCAKPASGQSSCSSVDPSDYVPGKVMVKPYKRPRPLVLRVDQGQCLQINFTNLLNPSPPSTDSQGQLLIQPTTRSASVHAQGLELVSAVPTACAGQTNGATCNDGSWVGQNPNGLVQASTAAPGQSTTYTYYASQEGTFLLYSTADNFTAGTVNIPFPTNASQGAGDGGQLALGLFGAIHVEPAGAEYYRSQVTATDLAAATSGTSPYGQPLINYLAVYGNTTTSSCYTQGTCRVGPVLSMLCDPVSVAKGYCAANEIVHGDLTAMITGPVAAPDYGRFPADPGDPDLQSTYPLPDRQEPYREVTIVYHETFRTVQAFPFLYNSTPNAGGAQPLDSGADLFSFNYGSGGIVSEILANRLGVGPQGECTGCKYEEFFLASWAVGDPAMVVDVPATTACTSTGSCMNSQKQKVSCDPGQAAPPQCDGNTCNLASFTCPPGTAQATKAYFPDDPSNVYHTYLADHTKFRVLHGGVDLHHIHHQHAHQWIASPNTAYGDYTDSQTIGPGSAFTLEMVYNGSGNVNQTVGDSIFHCHFYPHFASGMWGLWRVHDVYETGTTLTAAGVPVTGQPNRALPDGEIAAGTPIPAIVPMPSLPMPPMPAFVRLTSGSTTNGATYAEVCDNTSTATTCNNPVSVLSSMTPTASYGNPGYPFFIPGVAGQRAPHPPMDFAYQCPGSAETCSPFGSTATNPQLCSCANPTPLDGGLPRHLMLPCSGSGCTESAVLSPTLNPLDFSKELLDVNALGLPDGGTFGELLAMSTFANRFVSSVTPSGSTTTVNSYNPSTTRTAQFLYNGLAPVGGAPYADPCIAYSLNGGQPPNLTFRSYKAADIQLDAVFNKEGWHFPQQRMLSLWGDVQGFLTGSQPPEPLFFRANSGECVSYTLANLVPSVYELDDFQVRTPTDILGQHIHLVKFDVTSSDGAANGFNYEDGTFSPDEVRERIAAINESGGLTTSSGPQTLSAEPLPFFGPGPGGRWTGAQATLQRWHADPLLGGTAQSPKPDQTLRTVFTHDHFGPSTHQQAGLYAALVIEPPGSGWYFNEPPPGQTGLVPFGGIDVAGTGQPVPPRTVSGYDGATLSDGGPTTWQAVVVTPDTPTPLDGSFREFLLAIQDSTLTYNPFGTLQSVTAPPQPGFCADTGASCTPATAATMYSPTSCSSGTTCYGYGFCADTLAPCVDPSLVSLLCGGACTSSCANNPQLSCSLLPACNQGVSCNFIPGIPGGEPCTKPGCDPTSQYQIATSSNPKVKLFAWGTTAISPPASNPNVPETITLAGGTTNFSFNYRNEPLLQRVLTASGAPSSGDAGDMAFAYTSIARPNLQCQFPQSPTCSPYPPLTQGVQPGDPATPLLRANAGDDVQVRIVMGAHINPHNFTIHGLKWLMEPSFVDSGWRNSQVMSISEHFEVVTKVPPYTGGTSNVADYLYMAGASALEQAGGNWGLLRAYPAGSQSNLASLPQNQTAQAQPAACTPNVSYTVVANTYAQWYPGSAGLQYSPYASPAIVDPQAILFVNCPNGPSNCQPPTTPQPLVLRAAAGDCIGVTLYNQIPTNTSFSGAGGTQTSLQVGLHPQLVDFNVTAGNGFNVGLNPTQTAAPGGGTASYVWYAGNVDTSSGQAQSIPIEFGAVNLLPPDVLNHFQHGLFGALIVEPQGATCNGATLSTCTGTSAVITTADGSFQEFVALFQDGLPQFAGSPPAALLLGSDALNAINYQSMPLNQGLLYCDAACSSQADVSCVLSNQVYFKSSAACTQVTPSVPIFTACAGDAVRIRLLHAGGINTNQVFELHGHNWSDSPYQSEGVAGCTTPLTQTNLASSSVIDTENLCAGYPSSASLGSWQGSHMGHGPANHFDVVIDSAGGTDAVPGDYLFRSYPAMHFQLGPWGILRVQSCGGGQAGAGGGGR